MVLFWSIVGWVEVLNGSRNAITSVSEVSSLVNLRALILNSKLPSLVVSSPAFATICSTIAKELASP